MNEIEKNRIIVSGEFAYNGGWTGNWGNAAKFTPEAAERQLASMRRGAIESDPNTQLVDGAHIEVSA